MGKGSEKTNEDDEEYYSEAGGHGMLQMTADLIPAFSGRDKAQSISRWVEGVEDNAEIFGWTPLQQLLVARRALTGTAALWLRAERPHRTWADLKAALTKEFSDSIDAKAVHEMMSARKKKHDETCFDYMLVMKELGKRGKMPDYVAIKYIVEGIQDNEINKIVLYGVTTYNELKEKLKIYEELKEKMTANSSTFQNRQKQNDKRTNSHGKTRCYSCGELNHSSAECPHKEKGLKCFRCNEFGHISSKCTNTQIHVQAGTSRGKDDANGATGTGSKVANARWQPNSRKFVSNVTSGGAHAYNVDHAKTATSKSKTEIDEILRIERSAKKSPCKKPMKSVVICGKTVNALIDTGSDVNLMTSVIYDMISAEKSDDSCVFSGLGLAKVISLGRLTACLYIDNKCYDNVVFHVIPNDVMPYDLIIGQEFLKDVVMIMNDGSVVLKELDWMGSVNFFALCDDVSLGHVKDSEVKKEVLQCVKSYQPRQTKEAPIQLKIVLKDDVPVAQRPRRISLTEQRVVEQQVEEWLADGIIQVSYSEYSSPIVLVKKKDGSTRVCVDYRLINKKIVKDEFPLPVIEDLIDKMGDAKIFSVLDLKNGFFHLKVSEESVKYTSFVTHHGQFEFLRAPFGLSTCPKMFMRFVTIIFRDLIAERHAVEQLKRVLEVASENGLRINWKKAKLIQHEIEYLGHIIRDGEVRPSPEKTDAVLRYPEPRTIKQLHSFIGLASYFRKYVMNFAAIAKPLTELLKKDKNFVFDNEQRIAFQVLKEKMASDPVLKIFDPNLKTELHTDASSTALAAILMQIHPGTGIHPVHYMSRKTNEAQSQYSSYELEALAVIEGVKKFRHYLYGIHFKIVTDCEAFKMTLNKKDLTAKVARWVLFLDEYDYEIEHRSGTKMRHIDALSRNPCVAIVASNLHDQIRIAQDQDDGLKAIKDILQEKSYLDYWLENEILFKGDKKKLVIPRAMEKEVIQRTHSNGHFSKTKMKELIERDYYIRSVDKKIEDFILSCIPCLLATRKEGRQEGFLNPIEKESIPLDTIHLDHVGPLTETKKMYNYILTVIDGFTKFVWLFPTKTTSTRETLSKLSIHQQIFGNPRRFITDRGTAFTSNDFEEYCKEENIQHIKITTGVPRSNGQVERIHRVIIPALTKLCIEDQSLWYKHISRVQRALNSTFQRSIQTTPFELLIGTKMRNKADMEIITMLEEEEIKHFNEIREASRKEAKEQILKIQAENKKYYDSKRKDSTKYDLGDLVAIKRTQFGPGLKLRPKYLGPYQVVKIKRNDRYDVEKLDSSTEGPNKTSTCADHMKRWPQGGLNNDSLVSELNDLEVA